MIQAQCAKPFMLITIVCCIWIGTLRADRPTFTDVTLLAGITHQHSNPLGVDPEVAGAAAGDFDGDGWADLFFTQLGGPDRLYRNNRDGTFTDVSADAGFTAVYNSSGAAWGDIDNDGDQDLYVTTSRDNRFYLYVNDGVGHFTEEGLERDAAVANEVSRRAFGVAMGDYDRDGFLDILTSDLGNQAHESQSRLLRNSGQTRPGHFEDVTGQVGLDVHRGADSWRFTPSFSDVDRDGHTDVVFSADREHSQLFWNNGDNTFTDGTIAAAVGTDEAGMGSTIADFDGDGDFDWFVTAIEQPASLPDYPIWSGNRLFSNNGDRTFTDVTDAADVRGAGWGWGTVPIDYDNDGDLDLAATNGWHVWQPFQEDESVFWENDGEGRFSKVSHEVGISDNLQGRGLLQLDYDHDGDQDLLVVNSQDAPILYRNNGGNANSWLRLRLEGVASNRDALGAIITVTPDLDDPDRSMVWELRAGDSFLSQSESTAHFGLGQLPGTVDLVEIVWPTTRNVQRLFDVPVNSLLLVRESVVEVCDFSGDGACDVTDLDLMHALGPIAPGVPATGNEQFDLNGDEVIDVSDRNEWLATAAAENGFGSPYKAGDANIDGLVDGQDFIAWNNAKFSSSLLWSDGDFNADGLVDGQDFIAWNGNKFTTSDGVSPVPEPGSGMLSVLAMLALGAVRKRRRGHVFPTGHLSR